MYAVEGKATMAGKAKIIAQKARYIKLGVGGGLEALCLDGGEMRIGFDEVPHEAALAGDKEAMRKSFAGTRSAGKSTDFVNQVLKFYDRDASVIWITFARNRLWWCQAAPEVRMLAAESGSAHPYPYGSRSRRTLTGWHDCSIGGKPLMMTELHGGLTRTAGYRSTICDIKPEMFRYLISKINDDPVEEIIAAQEAKANLLHALRSLVCMTYWADFELLVDLIFSHSGWQRVSVLGCDQKTTDIELVLPSTGERATVQVKASTTQQELDDYVRRFGEWKSDRFFYVYHTLNSPLALDCDDPRVALIGPEKLAGMVLRAGLTDWLMQKVG